MKVRVELLHGSALHGNTKQEVINKDTPWIFSCVTSQMSVSEIPLITKSDTTSAMHQPEIKMDKTMSLGHRKSFKLVIFRAEGSCVASQQPLSV